MDTKIKIFQSRIVSRLVGIYFVYNILYNTYVYMYCIWPVCDRNELSVLDAGHGGSEAVYRCPLNIWTVQRDSRQVSDNINTACIPASWPGWVFLNNYVPKAQNSNFFVLSYYNKLHTHTLIKYLYNICVLSKPVTILQIRVITTRLLTVYIIQLSNLLSTN